MMGSFKSRTRRAHALLATAATSAFMIASPAWAADAQDTSATGTSATTAPSSDNDPGIVVIGTRRTDRSVVDSASPVDVIGSAELTTQPTANLIDSVSAIVPSFFVGQNTISDASTFVRSPSLRGLPGDEVLVMINGKRFNRSALVQVYAGGDTALSFGSQGPDISSIPSLALSNLQVLRDGATAQYGSDAIAGVLNFQLRNKPGLELMAQYGQYYDHGDGRSYQIAGNFGVNLGDRGFINFTGEYDDDGQTSRGAQRASAVYFAAQNPTLAAQLPNYPGPVQIWGSSPHHGYKLMLNAGYDLTDNVKFYLFGNIAYNKADESFNYREAQGYTVDRYNGTSTSSYTGSANSAFRHDIYLTPCPAGNATCPAGAFVKDANVYNFASLYPAGFTPRFVGVTRETYGTVGLKGDDGKFTWDLSGTYGRNKLDLSMYDSLSPSFGPTSQTTFQFGSLIQTEYDANLDLTYAIDAGLASPLTLSGGLEYRSESYEATAGDLQSYAPGPYSTQLLYSETSPGVYDPVPYTAADCPSYSSSANPPPTTCVVTMPPGASGYGGTSPNSAGKYTQKSWGAYLGLEGDLTSQLSVGLAGRYEHYDTFGDTTVGKFNAIYHVTPGFSIRGTVGTGFHAPSPGQNNVQILTTSFVQGNQVQTGTYPVTSPIAQYYGAKTLSPEKSTNFGLGIVVNPTTNFTLTVDGYSIKVRNRIGVSQTFNVSAADLIAQPALAAVGEGGAVQYFTNGFSTRTQGVDVVASYNTRLAGGPLMLTLAYNYNKSKVTSYDPTVIGPTQLIDIQYLAPNHRANFSANWKMGNFGVNLRESYYGVWRDSNDYPIRAGNVSGATIIDGQHFGAKFITDLSVSYTAADHYTLTVGANNLFNTKPDLIMATVDNPIYTDTNALGNGSIYPRSGGPFGFNGGFWYVKLGVKY